MKKCILLFLVLISFALNAQQVDHYFQRIRNNPAKLTAFFSQMPKGGDLHNHYSGSVYAESYIKWAIEKNYFINKKTLEVAEKNPNGDATRKKFSDIVKEELDSIKYALLQKWSIKDYNGVCYPADKLFFETFQGFNEVSELNVDSGLLELKARAKAENLNYIETMLSTVPVAINTADLAGFFDPKLECTQLERNVPDAQKTLDTLYKKFIARNLLPSAGEFCESLAKLHYSLHLDDSLFSLRYQTCVIRIGSATDVFKSLILAFEAADRSPLIVGVNIIGAENNEISMHDYWLHMQMFRFCHLKYPKVKYAMHAGELALGMVKPEELTWHISAAVYDAGAMRIGHGLDIPYEHNSYELMNYMKQKHIPVEINLFSNEFILKVKGNRHPVTLYKEFGVPIVICSDDGGVLRTNLTDQYVLLAARYPEFTYSDIKKIVYNSIYYSFIKEPALKERLIRQLNRDFSRFEKQIHDLKN